jgi:transketolase
VKEFFGFDPNESFVVPGKVLEYYRAIGEKGIAFEKDWDALFDSYKKEYPELAAEYELAEQDRLPTGWESKLPSFTPADAKGGKMATRQASGAALNKIAASLPGLIGGAADLAPSTDTNMKEYSSFTDKDPGGRNFHFGIREHAMGAILNGMALTKGVIPFGATFLIFSEYMRPPIRLAAIMKIRPIFVYTHDSIGLGEDGTTHQPVALQHKGGPVVLVLSRQVLPILDQEKYGKAPQLEKGAYILSEAGAGAAGEGAGKGAGTAPALILIATGSEVGLILEAQAKLKEEGIAARVVSMPSWELFERQDAAYRESVLPAGTRKRLAVEAGSPLGWHRYVTDEGDVLGMTGFGESAPAEDLYKEFGFTVGNVVRKAKALLGK